MPWTAPQSLLGHLTALTWQRDAPLARTLAEVGPSARIGDLGAGGRRVRPGVVGVDVEPGPGIDVVTDVHELPFPDDHFDLIVCTGTLNLCREPERVLAECRRVTVPGGLLHLEVGLFQPYHPEPDDYHRWTLAGLRLIAARAGFDELRSGPSIGPVSALANGAGHLIGHLLPGEGIARRAARSASHVVLGAVKYLDALIPEERFRTAPLAYGTYFVGRKPSGGLGSPG